MIYHIIISLFIIGCSSTLSYPDTSRCCISPDNSSFVSPCLIDCFVFRVCPLSICPRRPESRENIRRRCAAPLHRNLTSPPSLWPGRELRKYHCPQHLSSPPPGAARLLSCKLYRSLISEVVAHSRKRLRGSAHSVGNVPDAWIFSFQGSLSRKALRKLNLRIPCGEICPLTFQWTFF